MTERRLGRGLEYLISEGAMEGEEVLRLPIDRIQPNPFQPRRRHDEAAEKDLADSIKIYGVLQPIVVRRHDDRYEIVAGERRWRASKRAGLKEVPCVKRSAGDADMLALALVENIQREDLNPIEKALGFSEMMTRLQLTQEEVSGRLGMSRAAVANFLRLLALPKDIQDHVSRGTISFGHAKAIMSLDDAEEQRKFVRRILASGLSVREAEDESKKARKSSAKRKVPSGAEVVELEQTLMKLLGTKVRIQQAGKGGKIIIEFYSPEDFERLFEMIKPQEE